MTNSTENQDLQAMRKLVRAISRVCVDKPVIDVIAASMSFIIEVLETTTQPDFKALLIEMIKMYVKEIEPSPEHGVVYFAKLVHTVNNHICALNGEQQIAWEDTPEYMRTGLMETMLSDETPEQAHESWMKNRLENGWTLGPVKDIEQKISPCLVPYDQLPYEQKVKDSIRCGVREFMKSKGVS